MSAELFIGGWLALLVGTPTLMLLWQRFWVGQRWRRAARESGLVARPRWLGIPTIEGVVGEVSVSVGSGSARNRPGRLRVDWTFVARHEAAPSLNIRTRGLSKATALRTGDDRFDWEVMVEGDETEAIARLDAETRSLLRHLLDPSLQVIAGTVHLLRRRVFETRRSLTDDLARVMALARGVAVLMPQLEEALSQNAILDHIPEVRERNLRLLWARFPTSPVTLRTCKSALVDPVPRMRLAAASALTGPESDGVLRQLTEDSSLPEEIRCAALAQAARVFPRPVALELLDHWARRGPIAMTVEAIRSAGRIGHRALLERIATHAVDLVLEAQEAYATALGELAGPPPVEGPLLALLEKGLPAARILAARSLGKIGTVGAVHPLLTISGGLLIGSDLRRACEEAVAKIQQRAAGSGADIGQLSLHDPEQEGRLSLVGEQGALSLAQKAGALSLAKDRR